MENKELEIALKQHGEQIDAKNAEMKEALEANLNAKAEELKGEIEKLEGMRVKMQEQLDAQNAKLQKHEQSRKEDQAPSLESALKSLFESAEYKEAKKDNFKTKSVFEVKADTSNITGTVNLTQQNLSIKFAPERQMAFIPRLNAGTIGANKSRVLWVEGTYTSNVGYVGEGTGAATADAGTGTEKSRAMAKISAKLPLTAELLEDADYIASAFRMKMQEKALLFVDGECYTGNGSDGVNPNHIYGIVGQSTAYSATTTGANNGTNGTIALANIGDLVDDCILQAELSEQRGLNTLWMNPKDFSRFKKAKDANGQYLFVKDVNGNYTINGLDVVRSTYVTANTMTVADSMKIQLWWKRNMEVKFSQMNGTDFVDDAYTAVLFLRNQVVVEAPDQTAIIHVSDIDAAIALITAP